MDARMNGMVVAVNVGPKQFKGEITRDKDGNPVIERKVHLLDLDAENPEPIKVNFTDDAEEKQLQDLMHKPVIASLNVSKFGKYTVFRLTGIKAAA